MMTEPLLLHVSHKLPPSQKHKDALLQYEEEKLIPDILEESRFNFVFRYEIAEIEEKELGLFLLMATTSILNRDSSHNSQMNSIAPTDQSVLPLLPRLQQLSVIQHAKHSTTERGPGQVTEGNSSPISEPDEYEDDRPWDDSMEGIEDVGVGCDEVDYQNHEDYDIDQDDIEYQSSSAADSEGDLAQAGSSQARIPEEALSSEH